MECIFLCFHCAHFGIRWWEWRLSGATPSKTQIACGSVAQDQSFNQHAICTGRTTCCAAFQHELLGPTEEASWLREPCGCCACCFCGNRSNSSPTTGSFCDQQ